MKQMGEKASRGDRGVAPCLDKPPIMNHQPFFIGRLDGHDAGKTFSGLAKRENPTSATDGRSHVNIHRVRTIVYGGFSK